jgi:hypothetical protein
MNSKEALEFCLKIPEAERTKIQSRTVVFLGTIKDNSNEAVWGHISKLPIPADTEKKLLDMTSPKEDP